MRSMLSVGRRLCCKTVPANLNRLLNMASQIRHATGTLLLVDDDENVIKSLVRLLRSYCDQIFTAFSGEEALAILSAQRVDVIVSDSLMSPIAGIELIRRAKELYPAITTIVMSGKSDLTEIRRAKQERILEIFIPKPWEDNELIAIVRAAFGMSLQAKEDLAKTNQSAG